MNWGILGHEWAVTLLTEHILQGKVRHAYLICGAKGLGRRTLALRFAKALNCPHPLSPGQPCDVCSTCQRIEREQHPDLAIVEAEHEGGTLKVDQVRELQHNLALAPYEGRYRVAILLRFQEAHVSAANALLKMLEEPPPQVILVLTADNTESLLPTIVSRCEVLRLRPLPVETVSQGLQARLDLTAERARLLAHLSDGRPGIALQLHKQPDRLEQRQDWLSDHQALLIANRVERFSYAKLLTDPKGLKDSLPAILQAWLSYWRDVMLCSAGASILPVNLDYSEQIEKQAHRLGLAVAQRAVADIERTLEQLDQNVNARLAVEVLLLNLPYI